MLIEFIFYTSDDDGDGIDFSPCDQIERKVCGLSVTIALNFSLTLLSKQLSIFIFFKLLNLLTIFAEAISVFLITESS